MLSITRKSLQTGILCLLFTMGGGTLFAAGSVLFKKAETHYFNKRYYIAQRLFLKVLEEEPENGQAHSYVGDIYLIQGKLKKAEESFRIAGELSGDPAREFFRLGQVLYLRKNAVGALGAYKRAYKIDNKLSVCHFQMGMVTLQLLHNKQKTIDHWVAFRKLKPKDAQGPEIDRAIALLRRKDFKLPEDIRKLFPRKKKTPPVKKAAAKPVPPIKKVTPKPIKKKIVKRPPVVPPTRIPNKKAKPTKAKENNKSESIIEIDDL